MHLFLIIVAAIVIGHYLLTPGGGAFLKGFLAPFFLIGIIILILAVQAIMQPN